MSEKPLLYIEDEETDILLLRVAVQKARIRNPVQTVGDGEEAIAYLSGSGQYSDRERFPVPGLVLLDLNLPRLSGMKVLEWIRSQSNYKNLPVVIYSSSRQPDEVARALHLGANDYFVKPARVEQIAELVKQAKEKWLADTSFCARQ